MTSSNKLAATENKKITDDFPDKMQQFTKKQSTNQETSTVCKIAILLF